MKFPRTSDTSAHFLILPSPAESHFKEPEKEKQTKHKARRKKERMKIRAEVNEIRNTETIEKINETIGDPLKR